MRYFVIAALLLVPTTLPALAQNTNHRQPRPDRVKDPTSDAKRSEISAAIEAGQKRQAALNAKNTDLWARWTYAVCIGCGPIVGKVRIVYTTPARVLAGIPAAEDDARNKARGRQTGIAQAT